MRLFYLILLLVFSVLACERDFPGVGITVKNDSQDREYNIVKISATVGGKNYYASLKPGERLNIPSPAAGTIRFSRAYKDHTLSYEVHCPARSDRFLLKLIDVHLNRMAGGCTKAE